MEVTHVISLHLIHSDALVAGLSEQAGHRVRVVASVLVSKDSPQLLACLTEVAPQLLSQLLMLKRVRSQRSVWDDGNICFGFYRNRSSNLTP